MTLLVKNEYDCVQQNLDFHLNSGVDFIVAIDNGSTDGTREVLAEYENLGVAKVIDETGNDFQQSNWVTNAAMRAKHDFGADWILNNDADEFWSSPSGNLKQDCKNTSADYLICQRVNLFPDLERPQHDHWIDNCRFRVATPQKLATPIDIYRDPAPIPFIYRQLPAKVLTRAKNLVSVAMGNHGANFSSQSSHSNSDITIYHFPFRSLEQFDAKITAGGEAYARNKSFPETTGWHWRRWHHMNQRNGLQAALADAMPNTRRLKADLENGIVIDDSAPSKILKNVIGNARGSSLSRQATHFDGEAQSLL